MGFIGSSWESHFEHFWHTFSEVAVFVILGSIGGGAGDRGRACQICRIRSDLVLAMSSYPGVGKGARWGTLLARSLQGAANLKASPLLPAPLSLLASCCWLLLACWLAGAETTGIQIIRPRVVISGFRRRRGNPDCTPRGW